MHRKVAFWCCDFLANVLSICLFMFNNSSELKSGKECDGFTLISGADFRRDNRCFVGFYSEAFCVSSLKENMIGL